MTAQHRLPTAEYWLLHKFLEDRLSDAGPASVTERRLAAGVDAQLLIHSCLLPYRDHGARDGRPSGFIEGIGLGLRHVALRWDDHPDFRPCWAPPLVGTLHLLDGGGEY
ncbi:hypothetical protein OTB20_17400 [Streptomyces sp. H27-H1]|uniref:hypothetical protein n=1 Tax=Streptomyces sp. H27-H1 TaxID=2996461 RepID=UPI0022710EAB|nr:hypothetical protein [Streptomyces sp. H27-H1]MCY0927951.1 hypothetical protein [Streptomyces sp. H27-H1]